MSFCLPSTCIQPVLLSCSPSSSLKGVWPGFLPFFVFVLAFVCFSLLCLWHGVCRLLYCSLFDWLSLLSLLDSLRCWLELAFLFELALPI